MKAATVFNMSAVINVSICWARDEWNGCGSSHIHDSVPIPMPQAKPRGNFSTEVLSWLQPARPLLSEPVGPFSLTDETDAKRRHRADVNEAGTRSCEGSFDCVYYSLLLRAPPLWAGCRLENASSYWSLL